MRVSTPLPGFLETPLDLSIHKAIICDHSLSKEQLYKAYTVYSEPHAVMPACGMCNTVIGY